MKTYIIKNTFIRFKKNNISQKSFKLKIIFYFYVFKCLILLLIINNLILFIIIIKNKPKIIQNNNEKKIGNNSIKKSNIDLNDEFFQIKEVQKQIKSKNLTYINTIFGDRNKVGNALMTLNNLINVCENIKCKNIIIPSALTPIIKNPIFYKEYNITIYPYSYKNKIKIDIQLNTDTIFQFRYRKKSRK